MPHAHGPWALPEQAKDGFDDLLEAVVLSRDLVVDTPYFAFVQLSTKLSFGFANRVPELPVLGQDYGTSLSCGN